MLFHINIFNFNLIFSSCTIVQEQSLI